MEEQVISKSTAELAKEVGFNISSYKYYLTPYSEERFNHLDELYFIEDLTLNQN